MGDGAVEEEDDDGDEDDARVGLLDDVVCCKLRSMTAASKDVRRARSYMMINVIN